MIESLTMYNFQIHRKLIIEFDQHITTIVGDSDRGKSSILRALYWLCFARPSGTSIINHNAERVRVDLLVDGQVISRRRGRNKPASYRLDGKVFKAIGFDVPEAIANLLNVNNGNFQQQLDSPFWMMDTPGQLSKNLNAIVNLDDIDRTLSAVSSRVKKAITTVEVCDDRLTALQNKIDQLSWVEDFHTQLEQIINKQQQFEQTSRRLYNLRQSVNRVWTLSKSLERLEGAVLSYSKVVTLSHRLQKVTRRRETLQQLVNRVHGLQNQAIPDIPVMRVDLDKIHDRETIKRQVGDRIAKLRQAVRKVQSLQVQLDEQTIQLNVAKAEYKTATKGKCPLCGHKLSVKE